MILNKYSRDMVKEGDVLGDTNAEYLVTTIMDVYFGGRVTGKQITVCIKRHPEKCWEGHNIYLQPMSNYYGLEIKKKYEVSDDNGYSWEIAWLTDAEVKHAEANYYKLKKCS